MPAPGSKWLTDLIVGKDARHRLEDRGRREAYRALGYSPELYRLMAPGNLPFSGAVFPANPYYPPPANALQGPHMPRLPREHRRHGGSARCHGMIPRHASRRHRPHHGHGPFHGGFDEESMYGDLDEEDDYLGYDYESDLDDEDDGYYSEGLDSEASFYGHAPRSYHRHRPSHLPHPLHRHSHGHHGHHMHPAFHGPHHHQMHHAFPGMIGPGQHGGIGHYDDDSVCSYKTVSTW